MPLHVSPALFTDATRIAAIHVAAFGTNPMLLAQFPTPAIREKLQTCIAEKALADIRDPKIAVLVVRLDDDTSRDEVISFAKWSLPVREGEVHVETPWVWPEGTNLGVLDEWTALVERVKERVLGHEAFYCLSFIATDPRYERRGAASLFLQWALRQCLHNNTPAYLESTVEAGPLYRRLGFTVVEKIFMLLDGGNGESVVYEEVCLIFRPSATPDAMKRHDTLQPDIME